MILEDSFNNAQELFLILYSILYGIMLQSVITQSFPWGRIIRGYIDQEGEINPNEGGIKDCLEVIPEGIERNNWLRKMWRKRLLISIFILNILPLSYILVNLIILNSVKSSGFIYSWKIIFILWSSLGVFGFYRIHQAIAVKWWKSLYCDSIEIFKRRGTSFDAKAHSVAALFYFIGFIILTLIV